MDIDLAKLKSLIELLMANKVQYFENNGLRLKLSDAPVIPKSVYPTQEEILKEQARYFFIFSLSAARRASAS